MDANDELSMLFTFFALYMLLLLSTRFNNIGHYCILNVV